MTLKAKGIIKNYFTFISALLVFFAILFIVPEESMPAPAKKMGATALLMAILWITETIPIPVTAILPIVLFPILNIMPTDKVTLSYGHHLIFLFLGGFIIALTIERWNLHKRIALKIIHFIGTNQRLIILGFMIATAFLSMWISNTATTMMMIPIGMAIISQIDSNTDTKHYVHGKNNFALALMLGIAYSASIGGIATIIGTPPNVVFIGILKSNFSGAPEISFMQWMLFALPFSLSFLPLAWFYLVYIGVPLKKTDKRETKSDIIVMELKNLGPMSQAERATLLIFFATGLLWLFRSDIDLGTFHIVGWASLLGLNGLVQDSTVAIAMAVLTFIIPAGHDQDGKQQFLMEWQWAKRVPWGILLLFGGGFALANGFQESGLTYWLGEQLKTFHFLPLGLIIIIVCAMATFTTEFASNTAMASTLLPILAGLSVALGINPIILMVPATISCSTAFMLPIATPPNAIVFGSGYLQIRDMVKVGFIMNILGLLLIAAVVYLLAEPVFNIDWNQFPVWAK
jgi:sodium-dependent dicarboxylate transporter 2/3/5